jgi:ketosteroid isomerase-like protein
MTDADIEEKVRAYFRGVYSERDFVSVNEMIADPTWRHKAGEVRQLDIAQTLDRLQDFLADCENCEIVPTKVLVSGDYATALWNGHSVRKNGDTWETCGIEIFRFEGGKIAEIWNSREGRGHWQSSVAGGI